MLLRLYRRSGVCYNRDRFHFSNNFLKTNTTSETLLASPHYENQDRIFSRAFQILRDAIERKAFPGAAVSVTREAKLVALKALGHFTYEVNSPPVEAESVFDLASLTKVVATTSMAMV